VRSTDKRVVGATVDTPVVRDGAVVTGARFADALAGALADPAALERPAAP
jgi:hypothetical protein